MSAHSNNQRNSYNGNSRFGRNYTPSESSARTYNSREQTPRRSNFRKGVICRNCNKEGHLTEECYQFLGYPVGHPLHGKFKPQIQTRRQQNYSGSKTVNMAVTQDTTTEMPSTSATNDAAMSARMDQLQNQLNQMMLLMQNNKEATGLPFMGSGGKFSLIASHVTKTHKFIARAYKVIASILINQLYLWVVDSGATDHVCISLTLMHNIQLCSQPIYVTLPNGQNTIVTQVGSVHICEQTRITHPFISPLHSICLLFSGSPQEDCTWQPL